MSQSSRGIEYASRHFARNSGEAGRSPFCTRETSAFDTPSRNAFWPQESASPLFWRRSARAFAASERGTSRAVARSPGQTFRRVYHVVKIRLQTVYKIQLLTSFRLRSACAGKSPPLRLSASLYCSDGVASHHAENLPTKCRESASVLGSPFFNGSAYISGHCRQCRESDLHFARACTCALLEFYRTFQPPLTRK